MADYRLTQTGAQVQDALNQVPTLAAEMLQKYTKPVNGIPDSDLTEALQLAIQKAISAYQKPSGGIPSTDMAEAVRNLLNAAGSAYQKPVGGIPATDLATAVQNLLTLAGSAYQKPVNGIPITDFTASVQSAINGAAQAQSDIAAERLAREQAVSGEASARIDADATLRALITQVANDLANYYLKTQTYSKTEVNALVDAVRQFQFQVVQSLPTASADTVGYIYLVPASHSQTANVKEEWITISETSGSATTYKWEHIGSTNVDLSGYYTSAQVDSLLTNYSTTAQMNQAISNAINSALASYYTKTEIDNLVSTINGNISAKYTKPNGGIPESDLESALKNKINGAAPQTSLDNTNGRVLFIEEGLGKYDSVRSITLSQATAGKYVNTDGQEVSASGYGISAPIELNMGDILLVPSASAVPAAVSLFARQVVRTYAKVIGYTYTYQAENPELYETATADYDHSLVYYAVYDTSGETPTLTGWTRGGQTYTTLPATREVTESYYEPLMKQAVAAMPSTGYYVYLCPTTMTIVVSGYTATVNGGVAKAVGLGIFKNIATNFIGAPGQSVLAQAFADLFGMIDGLRANTKHLGECQATCIDSEYLPKVCGESLVIEAAGAPSIAPLFVGQRYHDTTNRKVYEAFAVTNNTNDWVLLN